MCDELAHFDGCERLIVIAVGLDADYTQAKHEKRSQLYRALTRAHLMVVVVNEFLPKGWFAYHRDLQLLDGELDLHREHALRKERQESTFDVRDASDEIRSVPRDADARAVPSHGDGAAAAADAERVGKLATRPNPRGARATWSWMSGAVERWLAGGGFA